MGEFADDLINQIIDNWGDHAELFFSTRAPRPRCRGCGMRFTWGKDEFGNSLLLVDGKPHQCPARVAKASEFPLL